MRERIEGLTDAVRQVLQEHDSALWWKKICHEIKDRGLVRITPEQEQITYGQPNFHHSIKAHIDTTRKRMGGHSSQ